MSEVTVLEIKKSTWHNTIVTTAVIVAKHQCFIEVLVTKKLHVYLSGCDEGRDGDDDDQRLMGKTAVAF